MGGAARSFRVGNGRALLGLLVAVIAALAFAAAPASAEIGKAPPVTVSEVTYDSAHVSTILDPKGLRNYYYFEYSTDQVHWTVGPNGVYSRWVEASEGPTEVTEDLPLKGGTKYYVRLAFQNEPEFIERYSDGPDTSLTTPFVDPATAVKVSSASEITFFTAKFTGEIERPANPDPAFDAHCRVEYVSEAEYNPRNEVQKLFIYARAGTFTLTFEGEKTKPILFNSTPAALQSKLEGLTAIEPGDIVVTGGPGDLQASHPYFIEFTGNYESEDVEQMFDSQEGLVGLEGEGDTYLETIAPGHGEEKFNRASKTPCTPEAVTTPNGKEPVEIELTGLTPGTTYHARLVAENAGAPSYLEAPNFTTVFAPAPTVTMNPVVNPGPSAVDVTATINPNGTRTIAWFEYSADGGLSWKYAPYGDYQFPGPLWCETYGGDDSCSKPLFGNTSQLFARTINEPNLNTYFGPDPLPLEPNTNYVVRIHAQNAGGVSTSPTQPFKTKSLPPVVQTLNGTGGPEEAQLSAKVNPKNASVIYQFEWGLKEGEEDETYENVDPVPGEGLPLADNAMHLVSTTISGLQPETTYHFRIVATDTQTGEVSRGTDRTFTTQGAPPGPRACPNESSRVGPSAKLPDCRAFEFVTPKMNQSQIIVQGPVAYGSVAPDGNHVTFNPIDAPVKAKGSRLVEKVLASRGPDGWLDVESLSPPQLQTTGEYIGPQPSTVDVSPDYTESIVRSDNPLAGEDSPMGVGLYLHKADGTFVPISQKNGGLFGYYEVAATSQDYTHIFFTPSVPQIEGDPYTGYPYGGNTYEWHNGVVKMLGILPGGEMAPAGAVIPGSKIGKSKMITPDGEKVLFSDSATGHLYLRVGGEETIDVSRAQRSTPNPNETTGRTAVGISPDGSQVLFESNSELTDDANTGEFVGVPNQANNIYRYNVGTEELTDLTVNDNPEDARRGAGVRQVIRVSNDFSYIYFVATGNLAPGGTSGAENIYVWHEGKIKFVGTDPAGAPESGYEVDATPDGKHLIFNSGTNQTAYDSQGKQMVYLYTYGDGLKCLSCRPSGAPPTADATTAFAENLISNDGNRVFFVTADLLLPQASNGQGNVYEWSNGEIHLLTPGDTEDPIAIMGASETGDDVFLVTTEELAKAEGRAWGIFDARVDAVVPQEVPPTECQGENCRGARTLPTEVTSAGTASFEAINRVSVSAPKSVRAGKVKVRVIAPGDGTISISGRGIKPVDTQASRAGSVTLTLALKPKADNRRRRTGAYRTKGEVLFVAGSGDVSRADVSLKFEASAEGKRGK